MGSITIRPAEVLDARSIARVHVEAWRYAYQGQLPDSYLAGLSVEKREQVWRESLNDPKYPFRVFVAVDGEKVVGFTSVCPCRDEDRDALTGELGAIYVDSEYMGKGIGSLLMRSGLDYLKEQGFTAATL